MNLTEAIALEKLYAMIREHSQFAHHGMTASCRIMGSVTSQPDLFPFAFLPVRINFA